VISGAFARLRRKSKDSSTDEVLRRRRRRDHRTTVTRHSLTVGCCGPEITLRLASIVLCPCSRPSHDGIAADLAARYLYRRSHSARNSRSSGDHGGSTSLKLILTQPKSALVKQYQRLFEMESIACPSVSIVCNPPGHACAPLCLGMRAAPLKMLCGIPAARGRRARRDDGRNCIGVAPLNRLVPGGRAPLTPSGRSGGRAPLTPIRPIGPGLPQKAGVSLFVATATPIGAICGRRVTHPSTSRGAGVKDRS
jgi:hypothetical protein